MYTPTGLRSALVIGVIFVLCACNNMHAADLSGPADAALPVSDATVAPLDAAVQADLACVPNHGPGCCYPTCLPTEALVCLGDNICGYPCHCEPRRDGFSPPDLACVPNHGPGCCYPTCLPGSMLSCLGANICGYPCSCVPDEDGGHHD